jgi:hypothetical protein
MLTRLQSAIVAGAYAGVIMCAAPAAHAQIDIEGTYNSEDAVDWRAMLPGPRQADFLGIPLNDEGRAGGLAYSQDTVSVPGHQCTSWGPQYLVEAGFNIRIFPTFDDQGYVQRWNVSAWNDYQPLEIWMDGRARPDPNGVRRSAGFTKGEWLGDTLQTTSVDLKDGVLTRNGVPASDHETMLLWFTPHDDLLSITGLISDPLYLTEPWVQAREFIATHAAPDAGLHYQYPCMQANEVPELGRGKVPFFLPGKNPSAHDMATRFHVPQDAAMGDPKAMYPEYRDQIKGSFTLPPKCTLDCCGWGDFRATANPKMECKDEGL